MTPEQLEQLQRMQEMAPMAAGIGLSMVVFYLVLWVFFAFCMAKIGAKLGQPFGKGFVWSLIPILNIIYMLQLAAKPIWWIVLFLVPVVNIVALVLVFMALAERRGKPGWWGVLMLVPIANVVVILMLAFGK